ncbi:hypothetical protein EJB05_01172, partial [Eragrostis curvula]
MMYWIMASQDQSIEQNTPNELCMLEHKVTDLMQGPNGEQSIGKLCIDFRTIYLCPTDDHQDTSDINSRQLKRLGSLRVTQTDEIPRFFDRASNYMYFCLDPISEQYCASTSTDDITGSVTLVRRHHSK